jgi:hypothetical protein
VAPASTTDLDEAPSGVVCDISVRGSANRRRTCLTASLSSDHHQ